MPPPLPVKERGDGPDRRSVHDQHPPLNPIRLENPRPPAPAPDARHTGLAMSEQRWPWELIDVGEARHPHATRSEPADYRPLGPAHAVMAGLGILAGCALAAVVVWVAVALWLVVAA